MTTHSIRTIDVAERRARLARRHRLAPDFRAEDVVDATRSIVCLHGTDPMSVYLAARARVVDMTVEDLDRALYLDHSLIKHMAMRRTLFVFPLETLPLAQAGASNRVASAERLRLIREVEKAGLYEDGTKWLDEASKLTLEFLTDGREASLSDLRQNITLLNGSMIYGEGKSWGGKVAVGPRVLTTLSAAGQIVRASNDGAWHTSRHRWASMGAWLGDEIAMHAKDEAETRLVELWLRSFGPGTVQDIKWWLGSTLTTVRVALANLKAVEVDLDGRPGFVLPDDTDPVEAVEPWATLLPPLDPTTMGWADREWYLGSYKEQLFDTSGNAGPTAWWNGRIVGGWTQDETGKVILQLLEDISPAGMIALEYEAAQLSEWLGGKRVLAKFPTPLAKTLAQGK